MQTPQNIINVTAANARDVLIEQSQNKVVLIDFWADWCEPCKQMMPILERIAADYADTLILAKVDCEAEQQLAAQFQIRSLPTLMVFKEGQPVDGVAGAQTEQAIRDLLAPHLPAPEDDALAAAKAALAQGNPEAAYTEAKKAFDLAPNNAEARLLLADAATRHGLLGQAKELLTGLTIADQGSYYQQILAAIDLAEQATDSPEIRALEEQVAQDPENLSLKNQLAVQYHQVNRYEDALDLMVSILQKDLNFADVKKQTIDMLNSLPAGDPLSSKYRRLLYSMLY
ncbi:MAG: thioredoxin [Idiomarina sp.]|nr:thioredoxin [Idiomarina sp.]